MFIDSLSQNISFLHRNLNFDCLGKLEINYTFLFYTFPIYTSLKLHVVALVTYGLKHNYMYPIFFFTLNHFFFIKSLIVRILKYFAKIQPKITLHRNLNTLAHTHGT